MLHHYHQCSFFAGLLNEKEESKSRLDLHDQKYKLNSESNDDDFCESCQEDKLHHADEHSDRKFNLCLQVSH